MDDYDDAPESLNRGDVSQPAPPGKGGTSAREVIE